MPGLSDRRGVLVALAVLALLVLLAEGQPPAPTLYGTAEATGAPEQRASETGPNNNIGGNQGDRNHDDDDDIPCSNSYRPESQCMVWKQQGECDANPNFMLLECKMACTECTPPPYISPDSRLGPYQAVLCEGGFLDMNCPAGYQLKIHDSFFGRQDAMFTCNIDNVVTYVQDCTPSVVDSLKKMCENLDACKFNISADVLGVTPCANYNHYLNATFTCELPMQSQTSCEFDYVALQCYAGESISVETAQFGSSNTQVCNDDGTAESGCLLETIDTGRIAANLCNGREWCTFQSSVDFFGGDPCPNKAKYTKVDYTCATCTNAYGDDSYCDWYAKHGECTANKDWMHAYCRKSCDRCDVWDKCLDVSDSDNCFYWTITGECHINPAFMHRNCSLSCNRCWEVHPEPEVTEPHVEWTGPRTMPAGTITSRQCGSEDLVLTCPQNQHILIHDVFYGRRNGSICPSATGVGNNILCDPKSSQPMEVAGFLCNGRQSCNLYPGNPPYDDPCPDIMTNRYLEASYTCEPCNNPHTVNGGAATECPFWQSWFECDYNPTWMNNNCFASCSGCNHVDCQNGDDGNGWCDYWASYGECNTNSAYMNTNCALSCRTCWALN